MKFLPSPFEFSSGFVVGKEQDTRRGAETGTTGKPEEEEAFRSRH